MNRQMMQEILEKIKQHQKIVISRHWRPDGDAVGSTKGLQRILQLTFPEKQILLINEDYASYLSFLGTEECQIEEKEYSDALSIILDTATAKRVSNSLFTKAQEIIKIDHHIEVEQYGTLNWVEENCSSASQMIVMFYLSFRDQLKIDTTGATYLYTGMVTDSGRFKFNETDGETLRCAAAMLDLGVDIQTLYAHLYLTSMETLKFKSKVLGEFKLSPNGVAYTYVSLDLQKELGITNEDASLSVSFLETIKDSLIWLAFIECPDSTIRVRLRSRFVTINQVAEHFNGGGHAFASGATVHSTEEMQALVSQADQVLGEYKNTHEGWL